MLQAQHALTQPSAGDLTHENARNNLMCVTGSERGGCILWKFNQKVLKWFGKLAEYNIPEDSWVLRNRGVHDWLGFVQHGAC